MTASPILIEGLTKDYDGFRALDGLHLQVEPGEVFGFLGPNGAGKTTAIRLLLDLIRPTAGRAAVMGFDCQRDSLAVRERVGYLPGDLRPYRQLRGREMVALIGRLRRRSPDPAWVERIRSRLDLDLSGHVGAYSKGNRQKLGVLLALLDRPPVLLLDEPTSGLDPLVQRTVWDVLREEADRGTTVFFSSHVMSEVEMTCERVGILREGRLVAVEPVASMKARALTHVEVSFGDGAPPAEELSVMGARLLRREGNAVEFEVTGEIDGLVKAIARHHVVSIRTEQASLDEILLAYYTGEAAT